MNNEQEGSINAAIAGCDAICDRVALVKRLLCRGISGLVIEETRRHLDLISGYAKESAEGLRRANLAAVPTQPERGVLN